MLPDKFTLVIIPYTTCRTFDIRYNIRETLTYERYARLKFIHLRIVLRGVRTCKRTFSHSSGAPENKKKYGRATVVVDGQSER